MPMIKKAAQFIVSKKREILLLFWVSVFCFIILETLARYLWGKQPDSYGYPPGLFLPDETKGYKYKPGFTGYFPNSPYDKIYIEINSKGLRDREHDYKKSPGVIRILGLGDSITFGAGVSFEDTYLRQLERKLAGAGFSTEIIKAGVNSYEFDQEYTYFAEEGYKYDSDVVVLGLFLNDIREITFEEVRKQKLDTENLLKDEGAGISRQDRSREKMTWKDGVVRICRVCEILRSARRNSYNLRYFQEGVMEEWTKNWPGFEKKLVGFADELEKSGAKLIIIVFPQTEQFRHSYNLTKMPQERLQKMGEEYGIEVVDLLPYLDAPNFREIYLAGDSIHFNKNGHNIISDVLYRVLVEKFFNVNNHAK